MDRVLLVIDDIQYSRHIEMTLRKVGFDVETINNEYNITDSILSYNPDYIVGRGISNRMSTLNVGKKIRESSGKYAGKVILIFAEGYKVSVDDLVKLRPDLLLFEPISTMKLAIHLFSFSKNDFETIKDKLLKFAITDNQFRNYEQQILRNVGQTLDSEIQIISSMSALPAIPVGPQVSSVKKPEVAVKIEAVLADNDEVESVQIVQPSQKFVEESLFPVEPTETFDPMSDIAERISKELRMAAKELPLRIDTYNHIIKKIDQDLKVGLKKRQTKKEVVKLRKDLMNEKKIDKESEKELGDEKIRFVQALFKKKT